MKALKDLLLFGRHTCPWWLAYTWDHRLRTFIHDPDRIIRPYINQGDRVLDVGCGIGFFSIAMAGYVGEEGRVYSMDIQQKMLGILMKRAVRKGASSRIVPVLSDGHTICLPGPVDFILSFWMLHEVDDKQGLLKNLHASLNPGGRFLLVEPKVHVMRRIFGHETRLCLDAGFTLSHSPSIGISRAALFMKQS